MIFSSWTRSALIRLVSFATFGVLVLGGFCYQGWYEANQYRRYIEYNYEKSFSELVSSVVGIDTALQKGVYASSPTMVAALAGEVSRKAVSAQNDLSSLPNAFVELENTAKFLSQLGDWAAVISRQAATGQPMSDTQVQQLQSLSATARVVSANLTGLMAIVSEERLNVGNLLAKAKEVDMFQGAGLGDSLKNLESEFAEIPILIYDGPFSGHIEQREPLFLKEARTINQQEAVQSAATYLGISADLLQPQGESAGTIPAYQFLGHIDGGETSISITKQGGYALSILSSRQIGEPKLTFAQAIEKAQSYLQANGFDEMKESYYTRSGNMLFINFAATQGDAVCYPDLIKVGIALDTGRVQIFEAVGYLMNHVTRQLPEQMITLSEAQAKLSPALFVSSAELCIIPTNGLNESLCYGFNCLDTSGQGFLIYVNVETGYEERILILLEDENGALTI